MMLGFSSYLVFGKLVIIKFYLLSISIAGLAIGLTYDRITKVVPLFIIL
jgi:hypothetical protein